MSHSLTPRPQVLHDSTKGDRFPVVQLLNGDPDIVFQLFMLNEGGESARNGLGIVAVRSSDAFFELGVVNLNIQPVTVLQGLSGWVGL